MKKTALSWKCKHKVPPKLHEIRKQWQRNTPEEKFWQILNFYLLFATLYNKTGNVLLTSIDVPSHNHFCHWKPVSITHSSVYLYYCLSYPAPYCIISSLTCLAEPYFSYYIINDKLSKKRSVFWFSLQIFSEIFLTPRRIRRDIILKAWKSSCKVHFILWYFKGTWVSSPDFRKKNTQVPNFMKIRPVAVVLFNVDGQIWRNWQSLFEILPKRLKKS